MQKAHRWMNLLMVRKYVYGDKPIWLTCVEIVEELGGGVTAKEVDEVLRRRFPHYKDNTRLNLIVTTVNCNRGHWPYNKNARRSDDVDNPHHKYDRLFKKGREYHIYDPEKSVYEIYMSDDGRWLTREIASDGQKFDREVIEALQLSSEKRREKLSVANPTPEKVIVSTYTFKRSALVVAEVLSLAGGKCQSCLRDAPFKREDGRPYLEVHHVRWLSNGGEDTVENAIALCPNCHREAHFGKLELKPVNSVVSSASK